MGLAAILDTDGRVANRILLAEGDDPAVYGAIACDEAVQIGWRHANGAFAPPPAPIPPEAPPVRAVTYKSDIARRCTEQEAQMLRGLLDQTSAQFWLLYMGVTEINHDAPEFPILKQAFIDTIGEERANDILAPSVA